MYIVIISILIAISLTLVLYKSWFGKNTTEHFYVATSNIAGEGLFATEPAKKDQRLFKALDLDHTIRKEVRKVNHCHNPNTYLVKEVDGWWVYAKRDLAKDEELSIDYRDTPDFIKKPEPEWTC